MFYIQEEFSITLEIKKSKFITYICPYDKFKETMNILKNQHLKARHFVYAYRFINEFDQIVENSSDDGEPKGTSGKPSLAVLSGAGIINSAVIIVRYFGGTRLGTGGLVRAYSDAVNQVLNCSSLIPYVKLVNKSIEVEYSLFSQLEYILSKYDVNIKEKLFNQQIKLILEASGEEFGRLNQELFRDCNLMDIEDERQGNI